MEKKQGISIYLDDERPTPDGYIRTFSVDETIKLIEENDGNVEFLSLDNDLGIGVEEGQKVLEWIEEKAHFNQIAPIPYIIIHTQNPVAADRMMSIRYNAWKSWENHGYNRREVIKSFK